MITHNENTFVYKEKDIIVWNDEWTFFHFQVEPEPEESDEDEDDEEEGESGEGEEDSEDDEEMVCWWLLLCCCFVRLFLSMYCRNYTIFHDLSSTFAVGSHYEYELFCILLKIINQKSMSSLP